MERSNLVRSLQRALLAFDVVAITVFSGRTAGRVEATWDSDGRCHACDDHDACTTDWLDGWQRCVHRAVDCDDQNACTTDACDAAEGCTHTPASCDDANPCTTDSCDPSTGCSSSWIPGGTPCEGDCDCHDDNACTTDVCSAGVCEHTQVPGCISCVTPKDCPAASVCMIAACFDGSCAEEAIPGCAACGADADCEDGSGCTTDVCMDGICAYTADPSCPACVPALEVCGDRIDNDGDGLVDYEDSDCCARPMTLRLKRMKVRRPNATRGRDALKLKTVFSKNVPEEFDPLTQDTSLQISDADGQIFCTSIPARHWMRRRHRSAAFWAKQRTFAGGLSDGRFRIKRNGRVIFRTHGRRVRPRRTDGKNVWITVRVGDHCSQTNMTLRSKKARLTYP